jgi:hypothetical protein
MTDIKENIKDILKPIRKQAQEETGIRKIIYSEMLRQINEKFPDGKVTRDELLCELSRQGREAKKNLEEDRRFAWPTVEKKPLVN